MCEQPHKQGGLLTLSLGPHDSGQGVFLAPSYS